jgi:hypothetical protein
MTFCSALANPRRDGFAIASLIRYKLSLTKGVLAGLFFSSGSLPRMKRISKSKESENQKD